MTGEGRRESILATCVSLKNTLGLTSADVTLKRPLRSTTAPSDASSPKMDM